MTKLLGNNFPLSSLLAWFGLEKRDFPWRKNPSFYEVLISEFMLQQTVASVVVPHYLAWMETFPSLMHLARAQSDDVIKAWEGLGYYSRARRLHVIAQILKNASYLPSSYEELKLLKGVGDYTARAILAFAYQKPEIALDSNVLRVGARFLALEESINLPRTKKVIQDFFNSVQKSDGQMAESLIELGALVCKKKAECLKCPLKSSCQSFTKGLTDKIPLVSKRAPIQKFSTKIAICQYSEEFLVIKHSKTLMQDLYEFPPFDKLPPLEYETEALGSITRRFTRFCETLNPFFVKLHEKITIEGTEWIHYKKLQDLPFSSGHRTMRETILRNFIYETSTY